MAILTGTTVNWTISPRIITISDTYTEVTVTDLHETLLDLEDNEEGMLWPHLRNTSGGEALGGGTTVGITVELQNAQIAFQARVTPLESGTATTGSSPGGDGFITLEDTAASFQTNNVARGDLLINVTDGSQCTVVSVQDENNLTATALTGGTDNDFDIGDVYDVYDVVQCSVSGGNLVAVDDVGSELSPIFPTFGTQVVRTASSSATTQNQEQLEAASFLGSVAIHPTLGTAGTAFPIGTRQSPSNNISNTVTIANTRGLRNLTLMANMTVSGFDLSAGYQFVGDSPFITLTVDPSADVSNCAAKNLTITGELDGFNTIERCSCGAITNVSGFIEKSAFQSTITLSGFTEIMECYSQTVDPDSPYPIIEPGANSLVVRDFHGSLGLAGVTGGSHVIGLEGGRLVLDATCTGGSVYLRGKPFSIVDNSTGTTVVDQTESEKITRIWQRLDLDPNNAITHADDSISGGNVDIQIVDNGDGTYTATQQ